jgi:integrase
MERTDSTVCFGLVSSGLYSNERGGPSGHTYNVYPRPNNPAIDLYTHMWNWKEFYETHLLGRKLKPDDYIFPSLGANGLVAHPHIPISSDIVQKRINEWAAAAGITGAGHFTTHCFRHGGAQYRFMFAPMGQRWTLARICWWGGWAIGEHVCKKCLH